MFDHSFPLKICIIKMQSLKGMIKKSGKNFKVMEIQNIFKSEI